MKDWHRETIVVISVFVAPNWTNVSYSERGSKMAVVTVLRPKIAYDHFLTVSEIQHDHHRTVCLLLRSTFTDQPIKI